MGRTTALSAVVIAALSLSAVGCTQGDESSEPTATSSSSGPSELETLVADYNVRNNAAIEAARQNIWSVWGTADTGAVLAGDVFVTRAREVFNAPMSPGEVLLHAERQFGAISDGYPRWTLAQVSITRNPAAPETTSASASPTPSTRPDDADTRVVAFEKASEGAPWLMSHSVVTQRADLPSESQGEVATTELQQYATVLSQLVAKWMTGESAPAWLELRQGVAFRDKQVAPAEDAEHRVSCALLTEPSPAGVSESARVVRAGSTTLIESSLKCSTTMVAANGDIMWTGGWEQLYPGVPAGPTLTQPWVCTVLVTQPDGANPAIIGIARQNML